MAAPINTNQRLTGFTLVMIAVVSVDSLRNLPIAAQYGFSLITFYLFAGLTFFFPLAWMTAKLVAKHPKTGGSYIWIKEAFGPSMGHLAIWLQWVYNMIWYPTIFAFVTVTAGSLIAKSLETNTYFIFAVCLFAFWALSFLYSRGLKTFSGLSSFSAIVGTLVPMFLIMGLSAYWLLSGHESASELSFSTLIPHAHEFENIGFFSNILFSLLGLEVIAMHAGNVDNAPKVYPKALFVSALLILATLSLSALSLCVIMPASQIALVNGALDVFDSFFTAYKLNFLTPLIGGCIILGGLGIASSWIVALARGLHVSLLETNAPKWLKKLNQQEMPVGVMWLQALVYSLLLCLFLFFPNINSSYWILSAMTAQFALVYYVLLFIAGYKLLAASAQTSLQRFITLSLTSLAIVTCLIGIGVGFIPPEFMHASLFTQIAFPLLSIGFIALLGGLAVYLNRKK